MPTTSTAVSTAEQEAIQRKIEELFQQAVAGRPMPVVLYHYTDSGGMKGIVESGTLRATHVAYLNDSSEYLHAVRLLLDRVALAQTAEPSELQAALLDAMEPNLAGTTPENVYPYFVACFSEEPNSLNQWRAYGRGEGAFCIGFSSNELFHKAFTAKALLCPVIYDRAAQAALVQRLLDWALAEYPARAAVRSPADRAAHRSAWVEHLFKVASGVAPMMKNPAFSEEREWRLIRPMQSLNEVAFLPKERGLSPYVSLRLGTVQSASGPPNAIHVEPLPDRLPISVVWTGPGQLKEVSRMAVQGLLQQRNYTDVEFQVSDIPYRVT